MQRLLQFTLDLFDSVPAKPAVQKPDHSENKESNRPPALAEYAQEAPESIASQALAADPLPTQTLQQLLDPATYRHPNASREALLGETVVAYQFRRGKRRTIGFSVGAEGLVVSAPKWVPLYEIDKAVQEKAGWIVAKLQETRARHTRLESARIDWKNGASLPFLGAPVTLVIDPRHAFGGVGGELKTPAATDSPGEAAASALHIALAQDATADQIRDSVQAWLMRQAKRLFTERLDHFAPQLGVQWRKLSLSSAGTRWGSASADGSIRLNWRLIHFKLSVIDYVVVHELSHLREMNHSPRFWDTVRAVVPDYAELRGQLKDEAMPKW
ncbi:SprT family zinc-dependent metalloprotease [Polaromonas sp. SM01]|uniref:M48 family metallopeptidase n=1 Tax=Polaromonas sp. SM01 TaxID=3085630 RepID=UPI0029826008|nr:SprT family zinc-dependent metalloprotease [Polaromonas sp. SM01]MDW5444716.1 SprT family zinc-dependent metalloprotease [Polaromonas sp. SM01]